MRHFIFFILFLLSGSVYAQTQHQNAGWFMFMNNTKFNDKWGGYIDMQVRSGDGWSKVRNLMFRPGITYYANSKNEFTLGYLLNNTYLPSESLVDHVLNEHRIWQQYVHKHKISTISASHRFRLEQRFIERAGNDDLFSQRLRYFVRFMIPLEKGKKEFNDGLFLAVQNELFFNIQHKNELNGNIFDQNRAYIAGGYRLNKQIDIEAGYLNQFSKGLNNNTVNNVVQLALYTRF